MSELIRYVDFLKKCPVGDTQYFNTKTHNFRVNTSSGNRRNMRISDNNSEVLDIFVDGDNDAPQIGFYTADSISTILHCSISPRSRTEEIRFWHRDLTARTTSELHCTEESFFQLTLLVDLGTLDFSELLSVYHEIQRESLDGTYSTVTFNGSASMYDAVPKIESFLEEFHVQNPYIRRIEVITTD